jgi:hypothetical protein
MPDDRLLMTWALRHEITLSAARLKLLKAAEGV